MQETIDLGKKIFREGVVYSFSSGHGHNSLPLMGVGLFMQQIEEYFDYVFNFENKIKYLKTQFTDDEAIIFHYSIEERELDKEIMDRICKSEHKYYQIKKSCYLKIALCFGLIKPKQVVPIGMVAQYE